MQNEASKSNLEKTREYAKKEWLKYHPEDKNRNVRSMSRNEIDDGKDNKDDMVVLFIIIISFVIHFIGLSSGNAHSAWGYFFFPLNLTLIKPILSSKASKECYYFALFYFIIAIVLYIIMICLVWKDFFLAFVYMLNTWYCIWIAAVCFSRIRTKAENTN